MAKMTRFLKGAAISAAVALVMAGCSTSPSSAPTAPEGGTEPAQDVTLTLAWWGNDDRAQKYQESLKLFEAKYPNIKVQTSFTSFDDFWTARNTEAASGSLPDVMQMDRSFVRHYAQTGQLLDLNTQIGGALDISAIDPSLLGTGQLGGKQYGIPTASNTLALFVNKDVTDKYGVEIPDEDYTWQDYNDFALELSKAGAAQTPTVYGGGDYTGTFWLFIQWLIQQDIEPFTDDGQILFTPEHMLEFINLAAPLRPDYVPTQERIIQLYPKGPFTALESASEFTWDNFLAGYVADTGADNFVMLPIPTGADGEKGQFSNSFLISASAHTEHPEEAATLIDFMINEPEVGRIFGTSKGVPATAAQREAMILEEGSIDAQVVAYEERVAKFVTKSAPMPIQGFGSIEAEYKRLAEEFGFGLFDAEEFVRLWFADAAHSIGR